MINSSLLTKIHLILLTGDVLTILLVTILGFTTHGTLESAGLRMLTTFIPLLLTWAAVVPFSRLYDPEIASAPRQLWRLLWAMIVAAPLAAWLRGAWLGTAILPLFILVLGGFSTLGLLVWRLIFMIIIRRMR